jgi:hypothetical protein
LLKKDSFVWDDFIQDPIYSSFFIENILDIDFDDLATNDRNEYRIYAYEFLNDIKSDLRYIKTHDAYFSEKFGKPIIPISRTKIALCIIRNPLAIAPSFANHTGNDIQRTIDRYLNNKNSTLSSKTKIASDQIIQYLGTWSDHVKSWVDQCDIPCHVMRYEDMVEYPLETFSKALKALGLYFEDWEVLNAIENSSFKNLQKLEKEKGFNERPSSSKSFFFKGKADYWKEVLSEKQIQEIISVNKPMMEKFGYL